MSSGPKDQHVDLGEALDRATVLAYLRQARGRGTADEVKRIRSLLSDRSAKGAGSGAGSGAQQDRAHWTEVFDITYDVLGSWLAPCQLERFTSAQFDFLRALDQDHAIPAPSQPSDQLTRSAVQRLVEDLNSGRLMP